MNIEVYNSYLDSIIHKGSVEDFVEDILHNSPSEGELETIREIAVNGNVFFAALVELLCDKGILTTDDIVDLFYHNRSGYTITQIDDS